MSIDTPLEPITEGIHHLGLSVLDITKTSAFFINVLGYKQVGEVADYPAIFVSDGSTMLTLWQLEPTADVVSFDRKKNAGLHHFALKVKSHAVLDQLHNTLQSLEDVDIEFAPLPLGDSPMRHMMCIIPGGLRVEFIAL